MFALTVLCHIFKHIKTEEKSNKYQNHCIKNLIFILFTFADTSQPSTQSDTTESDQQN